MPGFKATAGRKHLDQGMTSSLGERWSNNTLLDEMSSQLQLDGLPMDGHHPALGVPDDGHLSHGHDGL